jgi:hypothetical protein
MPDLERIQQNTPGTISQQWTQDGAVADPGTVTVGITRADGAVLVAAGAATSGTATAPRTFNLTTTHTALLDSLKVTWTSPTKGTLVSYIDVVGGNLFTLARAQALLPTATVADIADARTYAETEIEAALGYALVPRYIIEKITGRWCQALRVSSPYVRTIRSATVNGVALSAGQLADLSFANGLVAGYPWGPIAGAWGTTLNNVTIGYEHGLDTPPPGASRAALDEAVAYLGGSTANGTGGGIDPRAESVVTVDGTVRLRASTGTLLSATAADWVQANRLLVVA